ncbi:hypothetical protein HanRHA438_Chr17g0816941 [Helianthus annuus]|nr:hypothetical protein HanRHA438_Chr17g0816941 [Helianthus annuus]
MMLKHCGHETCSKICRMSVRLVVRSRCSLNYDGMRISAKNDPNDATNGFFSCQTLR